MALLAINTMGHFQSKRGFDCGFERHWYIYPSHRQINHGGIHVDTGQIWINGHSNIPIDVKYEKQKHCTFEVYIQRAIHMPLD